MSIDLAKVLNAPTSPLDEAKPESLEDLFNKDPLELTKQDLERTVLYLRHARETFLRDEAAKVPRGAKKTLTPVKVALDQTVTVNDLEID